jgi:hypothetical protein
LNDRAGLVDHEAEAPVFEVEGQAATAAVVADAALGPACDPARAHRFLQQRW